MVGCSFGKYFNQPEQFTEELTNQSWWAVNEGAKNKSKQEWHEQNCIGSDKKWSVNSGRPLMNQEATIHRTHLECLILEWITRLFDPFNTIFFLPSNNKALLSITI